MLHRIIVTTSLAIFVASGAAAQTTHSEINEAPPEPGIVQGCGYYAILGAAPSLGGAFDLQDRLDATGSGILNNDNLEQFRDGFHSVVYGPFGEKKLAEQRVGEWQDRVPDAFVKYGCVDGASGSGTDVDAPVISGVLPLIEGTYVREGTSCEQPRDADIRVYNGQGVGGPQSRNCDFDVTDREGALYGGTNTCETSTGSARIGIELSVRVLDTNRFRLAENQSLQGKFRHCAGLSDTNTVSD
ncbi:MAG: hypothetical protein WBG95_17605 [Sulfitobacter sp.]